MWACDVQYRVQPWNSYINRTILPQASHRVVIVNLQLPPVYYHIISEMVQASAKVTIVREYEVLCVLLNGVISNDFEWPLIQVSKS